MKYLDRHILTELQEWKGRPRRYPLLLRGARQVGKSFAIKEFASKHFENFVEINLELQPHLKAAFESLDPSDILRALSITLNLEIIPGKALLFIDEIQECPKAITALRYFYEKLPQLHVIGAGSLLEFALNSENFNMPVGRVEYLFLYPLSFLEFLKAKSAEQMLSAIKNISLTEPLPQLVHEEILKKVREYFIVGGMPAVVSEFLLTPESRSFQRIHNILLQTYRDDFGKYAKKVRHADLAILLAKLPTLLGQRIKYSHINPDRQSRELKEALSLLCAAGIFTKAYAASGAAYPLGSQYNEAKFKIVGVDIGLMQTACGLEANTAVSKSLLYEPLLQINNGGLAEQFVAQELMAYANSTKSRQLFFWTREENQGNAEIDYLLDTHGRLFPVEVKSGSAGRLTSLRDYGKRFPCPCAIRISELPLSYHQNLLTVPLYAISQIPALLAQILKS